jgi:ribonuclease Z
MAEEFQTVAFGNDPERATWVFEVDEPNTFHTDPVTVTHESGRVLAYSCDTAPSDNVVHLAQDADVLVHEANGTPGDNHSTAAEAAEAAAAADVDRLLLVHLPPGDKSDTLKEARSIFPHTDLGTELGTYSI